MSTNEECPMEVDYAQTTSTPVSACGLLPSPSANTQLLMSTQPDPQYSGEDHEVEAPLKGAAVVATGCHTTAVPMKSDESTTSSVIICDQTSVESCQQLDQDDATQLSESVNVRDKGEVDDVVDAQSVMPSISIRSNTESNHADSDETVSQSLQMQTAENNSSSKKECENQKDTSEMFQPDNHTKVLTDCDATLDQPQTISDNMAPVPVTRHAMAVETQHTSSTASEDQTENKKVCFTDNPAGSTENVDSKNGEEVEVTSPVLGTPIDELPTNIISISELPSLAQTGSHTILIDVEKFEIERMLEPFPDKPLVRFDRWDNDYVHMPYSAGNDMQKTVRDNLLNLQKEELEISDIESALQGIVGFSASVGGLADYFDTKSYGERKDLLILLKKIAAFALELPDVCTRPIPILKRLKDFSISMSQKQAACLLANAFYCTFPQPPTYYLVHLSFLGMFRPTSHAGSQFAKLDCIFNYFRRVFEAMPSGVITFHRKVLEYRDVPVWETSNAKLVDKLAVNVDGRIESDAPGMLHVDFANKCIGGGVLGEGRVQEEILFVLCPELIVSRLIAEEMADNETIVVRGYERFSSYRGYSSSFEFTGDYVDKSVSDEWCRRANELVAMDAMVLWGTDAAEQLMDRRLKRELNKAYCGFRRSVSDPRSTVATGNWGCGAFGGDPHIKALIQLMAASEAQRPLYYFTFHDDRLADDLIRVHKSLVDKEWTVGQLYCHIVNANVNSAMELYSSIVSDQPLQPASKACLCV